MAQALLYQGAMKNDLLALAVVLAAFVGFLSAIGLGMFGIGAIRVPGWARLRRRQMEAVAARLALATKSEPPDDPPTEEA